MSHTLPITRGALLGLVLAYFVLVAGGLYAVKTTLDLRAERAARIHDTCDATNSVVKAIRSVLHDGIKSAKRGEVIFPQFMQQYEEQIRQNRKYLATLFVVKQC